jgi:hypothetical protein
LVKQRKEHPSEARASVVRGLASVFGFRARGQKARRHEVVEAILADHSEDYTVIRDWTPLGAKQPVDMVILGKHGVLVVQCESFVGTVECRGDSWQAVRPDGRKVKLESPSKRCRQQTRLVAEHLRKHRQSAPVMPMLVFPDETDLELREPSMPVVRMSQLAAFLDSLPAAWRCDERIFGQAA